MSGRLPFSLLTLSCAEDSPSIAHPQRKNLVYEA